MEMTDGLCAWERKWKRMTEEAEMKERPETSRPIEKGGVDKEHRIGGIADM